MTSKSQKTIIVGLTVALIFVVLGVFIFSYAMETLDVKAEELGATEQPIYEPPFPDYSIVGMENEWGALLIGISGTLLLFIAGLGLAKILNKKRVR
jgi:ABC-type antimicrobial peptide transport system permease subunit